MTRSFPAVCLLVLGFLTLQAFAAPVQIRVLDGRGSPLPRVLVIVQVLQPDKHEIARMLTAQQGDAALGSLDPGLYRAIAADPYGPWETEVREFLVTNEATVVTLRLRARETSDPMVAIVGQLTLHVFGAGSKPVSGARVLIRDAKATPSSEHWATTNASGTAILPVTANASVIVVVASQRLYRFSADAFDTERTVHLNEASQGQ